MDHCKPRFRTRPVQVATGQDSCRLPAQIIVVHQWDVSGGVNSGQFGQFEIRDGRDWVKRVQSGFSGGSLAFDDDGFGLAELNRAVATCVGMAPGERGR